MATVFHENNFVTAKLNYFIQIRKIPNIVFHGSSGCGKRTIVGDFINRIYGGDRNRIKNNVMFVNCAHGKGIKFIRDELKHFAKANMQCNDATLFKSIVLYNADELTIDAQSALRRCIELFSHNTRFFIVVENKHKLLKPILSRFCEIYIPDKTANPDNPVYSSLHKVNREKTYGLKDLKQERFTQILDLFSFTKAGTDVPCETPTLSAGIEHHSYKWFLTLSNQLYEDGISCLDILEYLEGLVDADKMVRVRFCFEKVKGEFRSEKMLMMYLFDYMFLRSDCNLKNVSFL